jgi:sigma-B regulation protein RsbU (phosphoserine phosphatase)
MALGLWEPVMLDERSIELPPDSTLFLFTDGMTDCRDPQGEAFGMERIKTTLGGLSDHTAQHVCDHMLGALINYQDGAKQDDDVTLVAIRVAAKG